MFLAVTRYNDMKFATFNVRGIQKEYDQLNLAKYMKSYNIDNGYSRNAFCYRLATGT